jgi:hypothetical protein
VSGRDIGASVRQRLLNKSRTQGRPFQEVLQYFAMERFLYRLAKSPYSDRFVLKGAERSRLVLQIRTRVAANAVALRTDEQNLV